MRQASHTGRRPSLSIPTNVGARVVAFIRARHPGKTADNVAAETGVSAASVAKWLERGNAPNAVAMLMLIAAYGPEFLASVVPHAPNWLSAAARAEQLAAIDAEFASLQRRKEALR